MQKNVHAERTMPNQSVQRMSAVPFWASGMLGVALIADLYR
jgi:hypothetical protein